VCMCAHAPREQNGFDSGLHWQNRPCDSFAVFASLCDASLLVAVIVLVYHVSLAGGSRR
jgi:hypothetical protein